MFRDLYMCIHKHSIQITNYNLSGVNVGIVALNCFIMLKSVNAVWKLRSASIV